MTGEELYALYEDALALQNCEVDPWTDLDQSDRDVWNYMAERLQPKEKVE